MGSFSFFPHLDAGRRTGAIWLTSFQGSSLAAAAAEEEASVYEADYEANQPSRPAHSTTEHNRPSIKEEEEEGGEGGGSEHDTFVGFMSTV